MSAKYQFEFEHMEFSKDGSLDELIALDRYTVPSYDGYLKGDTVVAIVDESKQTKMVCEIEEFDHREDDIYLTLRDRLGVSHEVKKSLTHKPLELKPSQMWTRWAKAGASVESTPQLREFWENEFRWLVDGFRYSLGGRIQLMLGQEHVTGEKANLTAYNCFSGDTIVQTKDGAKYIKDLNGEVEVLSQNGVYRKAYFKSYGQQELFEVSLENGEKLKATAGHEWIVSGSKKRITTLELEGKKIPIVSNKLKSTYDNNEVTKGIKHGIFYADGTISTNGSGKPFGQIMLFGEKRDFSRFFQGYTQTEHHEGKYLGVYNVEIELKQLPSIDKSESYWYGFIMGLIATDGSVDDRGSVMIHSSKLNDLVYIAQNMYKTGFVYSSIKMTREFSPYNGKYAPCFKMQLVKDTVNRNELLKESHYKKFVNSPKSKTQYMKVISVKPLGISETVYCCEEPETRSFVVGTGYLSSNCYVARVPKGKDTPIEQFLEVIEVAYKEASIMRVGGGVGLNIGEINTVMGSGAVKTDFVFYLDKSHKDHEEFKKRIKLGKFKDVRVADTFEEYQKLLGTYNNIDIKVKDSVDGMFLEDMKLMIEEAYNDAKIIGLDFNSLRERNALVKSLNARSSGAVAWMEFFALIASILQLETIDNIDFAEIFSSVVHLIIQGGSRRGALMLINPDSNENVFKFIERKKEKDELGKGKWLTGANISVGISDVYMAQVKEARYLRENGTIIDDPKLERALKLWDILIQSAWQSAEPGVVWMERYNKESNSWYFSIIVATNPCGV